MLNQSNLLNFALPEILADFNNSNAFNLNFSDNFLEGRIGNDLLFDINSYKRSQKMELINHLYQSLPVEPIIKYLNKMRSENNCKLFQNFYEAFSDLVEHNKLYNFCLVNISDSNMKLVGQNSVQIELMLTGDTLDAIYYPEIDKIKKIELVNSNLIFKENKFVKKEYELQINKLNNNTDIDYKLELGSKINTILLSDYSFPLTNKFQYLNIIIEFNDENFDPKKIKFINGLLDLDIRNFINSISFELNVQKDNYLIFSHGLIGEHFVHIHPLSPKLKKIFDEAEQEAQRRKNM